jgi:rhodanese-related sulfurtransferase/ketosteroid isomerase-like protein
MADDQASTRLDRLEQFSAAWTAGDVERLMSFVSDDCVYSASVGPEPGTTYRGRAEVRDGFARMLAYDQGRERHGGETIVVGDAAYAEWSFDETTLNGERRTIRGFDVFRFRGDQITQKDAFRKVLARVDAAAVGAGGNGTMPGSSPVTTVAAADPTESARHFNDRLAHETDCADVWKAIESDAADFVLVDCRPEGNYNKAHLPGAISLPWQEITADRLAAVPDRTLVTYCWGPSCNAATKGAQRLAALGRPVKEMIGGLEYWIREGHPTEGRRPVEPAAANPIDWGLVT